MAKILAGNNNLVKAFVGTSEVTKIIFNGATLYQKSSVLSTFTFSHTGQSYQFEEGMTWAEWVQSEYNLGKFGIDRISDCVFFQESVLPGEPPPPPLFLTFDNRSVYGPDPVRAVTYEFSWQPY